MLLRRLITEMHDTNIIAKFIQFAVKELNLESLPKSIKLSSDPNFLKKHMSFGAYIPDLEQMMVYSGKRHIVDVLRTLAHELVHHRQKELDMPRDGTAGSPVENEANAKAGVLMRKFGKMYPEIFLEN